MVWPRKRLSDSTSQSTIELVWEWALLTPIWFGVCALRPCWASENSYLQETYRNVMFTCFTWPCKPQSCHVYPDILAEDFSRCPSSHTYRNRHTPTTIGKNKLSWLHSMRKQASILNTRCSVIPCISYSYSKSPTRSHAASISVRLVELVHKAIAYYRKMFSK